MKRLTDFERGFVVGLLIGEGSFGVDGRRPHITIKMHVRHEELLRRLHELIPEAALYGPYESQGRHFFVWTLRGDPVRDLLEQIDLDITEFCPHVAARMERMIRDGGLDQLAIAGAR